MNDKPSHYCTMEEISQMLIGGVEEIIGLEEMELLLKRAKIPYVLSRDGLIQLKQSLSIKEISQIKMELENLYGELGSRGAVLRAGRTFFQDFFKKYGIQIGLNSLDFRMLPLKKRIITGMETISITLSTSLPLNITVSDDLHKWYWLCQMGGGAHIAKEEFPTVDFTVGLLQAYLSWVSGGKSYPIQKSAIATSGYLLEIEKKAIG